jgi:hypothetical protein
LSDSDLARLQEHDFVVSSIERTGPSTLRIVVDDADRAMDDISSAVEALGATVAEVEEHVVDYDEAFVRVVERHRNRDGAVDRDTSTDESADRARTDEATGPVESPDRARTDEATGPVESPEPAATDETDVEEAGHARLS